MSNPTDTVTSTASECFVKKIPVTFRDRKHFYSVVNWLNEHVGRGKENWTIHGRPLKVIKANERGDKKPAKFNIAVKNVDAITDEDALYLNMGL